MAKKIGAAFLLLFFVFSAAAKKRFFCNSIFIKWDKDGSIIDTGRDGADYWDRVFYYKKSGASYAANFPLQTDPHFEMRRKGDFLSGFFQDSAGEKNSRYRGDYVLYRLNTKTGLLIKSYVHYASAAALEEAKRNRDRNPYAIPLSQKPLEFIDKKPPREGFVKFGYEKSAWRCRRVSYPAYLLYFAGETLMQLLGV